MQNTLQRPPNENGGALMTWETNTKLDEIFFFLNYHYILTQ